MREIKRAVHLDFHTMPGIADFSKEFDAEKFAVIMQEAKIDYINVFARCNIGYSYYNTKIGIPYPGMKCDMLGEMTEALHKRGIGISAYVNAGLNHIRAEEHREWCRMNGRGQVLEDDRSGNFFRTMCLNTAYGDYLMEEVEEVVRNYDVDGIFIDCISRNACYGYECLTEMEKRGININDPKAAAWFTNQTNTEYFTKMKKLIPAGKLYYLNALIDNNNIHLMSHVEIECLPTGGWGYDALPALVKYDRKFGKDLNISMTGRFHKSWGDFGGLRTKASLEYDVYYSISNGLICSVGDHMHPRGMPDKAVYKVIGEVFAEAAKYDEWALKAKPLTEAAIVVNAEPFGWPTGKRPVKGAARMLDELKVQYDILDSENDFNRYKVVILPDDVTLGADGKLAEKLKLYIKAGGKVISSGYSGLDEGKTGFCLPEWDFEYCGEEEHNVGYFKAEDEFTSGLPDMEISTYMKGIAVKPGINSRSGAELVEPYFSKHWDGHQGYYYVPPYKSKGLSALAYNESVYHISFPIFEAYFNDAYPNHKYLFENVYNMAVKDRIVYVRNLPSYGRIHLTHKANMLMAHVLCYCPEVRGKSNIVEEPSIALDVAIRLKIDAAAAKSAAEPGTAGTGAAWPGLAGVKKAYLAPDREELAFTVSGGYVEVLLPKVVGYAMVVFEK